MIPARRRSVAPGRKNSDGRPETSGRPSEFFGPGATELQLNTLMFVVLNECLDADYGEIICF